MDIPIYLSFDAPVIKTVHKRFEPIVLPPVPTLVPADSLLHHSHTTELVSHIGKNHEQLSEFVDKLINNATWYKGSKGNIVNFWV